MIAVLVVGLPGALAGGSQDAGPPIVVEGERPRRNDDAPAKLDHILPEVDATRITVTKKTTVTKLDRQPPLADENPRELFARSPGIFVSEQQTPTQFNVGYRGLGNPQESEYVLVLQDGIPIQSDWIGFPTLYYMPLPQDLVAVEEIRGGSSLLYGPEPAPAINLVSRRPHAGSGALEGSTRQVAGSHGLHSTFNLVEGVSGAFEYRAFVGGVASAGDRQNARSRLAQADVYLGYRPKSGQLFYLRVQDHAAVSGDPGRISYAQFLQDPRFAPTPFNRDWVRRGAYVLGSEIEAGRGWRVDAKAWLSRLQLYTRAAAAGARPVTTTLQDENFRTEGIDVRARKRWGRGNAFTFGATATRDSAPFGQYTSGDITAARGERTGTPRLLQQRQSRYAALFGESLFRFPHKIHLVLSARFDFEALRIRESVRPPNLNRPVVDVSVSRSVPLFGIGIGNDFGRKNETYFSITQGYRPLRFFDVASPFSNLQPGHEARPPNSTAYEAGVHGTPVAGLFYDVSLFWIDFRNRIETQRLNATDVINVNTGDTRHRGVEGEISYDLLAGRARGLELTVFASASLLDAKFVRSNNPAQIGRIPAYAPSLTLKGGITWRRPGKFGVSLTGSAVSSQFFQDSNQPAGSGASFVPARIPAYQLLDLSANWEVTPRVQLSAGVHNLADARYYARVFQTGLEPGKGRTIYGGISFTF
jgi:Fe(3+) dicitrate transport protein